MNADGQDTGDDVTLYHYSDGYPEYMLPKMAEALEEFSDRGWELGRPGKAASFLCAVDPGIFEPEAGHTLHGDIEYYYKLFVDEGTWDVEVYNLRTGRKKIEIKRGDLLELAEEVQKKR
jgi:hypothetical protein